MWKRTTLKLTINYSLIFLTILALFSGGIYFWVNRSFSDGFVEQVRGQVEQNDKTELSVQQTDTAYAAADIAVHTFRNILLMFDLAAVICVPFGAYYFTRRTLRPLITSQEKQQQFIANASHELRTPLAVINGELELALRKAHSVTEYKKALFHSKREVEHMTNLTKELLLLAQLDEMHNKAPEMTAINLYELLEDVRESLAVDAHKKPVELRIVCPKDVVVMGNSTLINIALSNLIHNAIKYSPTGSRVDVIVQKLAKNRAQIVIRNQGNPIDKAHQSQLFDRFYQIKNDRNGEGFGLGLAIVKEIITLHHGKIRLTSTDQGTAFSVTL